MFCKHYASTASYMQIELSPPPHAASVHNVYCNPPTIANYCYLPASGKHGSMSAERIMNMITLFLLSLAVVAVSLMVAGYVLAHRSAPVPQFAKIRNGHLPPLGQRKPH